MQLLRTQEIHPVPPGRDRAEEFIFWPTGQGRDGDVWEDIPISPSSLSTNLECERKWGWHKIGNIQSPPTAGQIRGTEHHGSLEDWFDYGSLPPPKHDRLLDALAFFPKPGAIGLSSERYFALWLDDGAGGPGVVFHGYTDADVVPNDGSTPEVYDLKTTKDMSWAKTETELAHDPQATIYALKQMVECQTTEAWTCWVYCQMEGRKASIPVRKKWTLDEALGNMRQWLHQARSMVRHSAAKTPVKSLAFNASACGAYGGCHYVGLCALTNRDKMLGQLTQAKITRERKENSVGLKDVLAKARAEKGLTGPVPTGGSIPVQQPAKPKEEVKADPAPAAVAAVVSAAAASKLAEVVNTLSKAPASAGSAINPPDASPDPRTAKPGEVPVLEDKKTKAASKKAADFAKAEAAAAAAKASETSRVPGQATEPKPAKQEAPARQESLPLTAQTHSVFTLLVGCYAAKGGQAFRIEDLIAPARAELEGAMNVHHYKLIDFNKGPAMLAAGLRAKLKETKPIGVWSVDPRAIDPEILAVLQDAADCVICR